MKSLKKKTTVVLAVETKHRIRAVSAVLDMTALMSKVQGASHMLHFVGFKDDRYNTAVKTFGKPDFIHRFWDYRAFCEVVEGDVVVFADGDENSPVKQFAFDDSANF